MELYPLTLTFALPCSQGVAVVMRFFFITSLFLAFSAETLSESTGSVCSTSPNSGDGASVTPCKGGVASSNASGDAADVIFGSRQSSNSKSAIGRAMLQTGNIKLRPLSLVERGSEVLQSDLSQFESSAYLRFNSSQPVMKNAHDSFEHFMQAAGLSDELIHLEKVAFKQRFLQMVQEGVEKDPSAILSDDPTEKYGSWARIVGKTLEDAKPVLSRRHVSILNRGNLSWLSKHEEWMINTSAGDVRNLCGAWLSKDSENSIAEEKRRKEMGLIDVNEGASEAYPDQFDSRDYWPMCRQTIAFVRDQGQCGSCWAMTTAKIIESHLCIKSNGTFSGPSGHISAGYLASCANRGRDGCSGGFVDKALLWASRNGVPTGGQGDTSQTCVPYFASGSSLEHFFAASHKSPACPKQCTNKMYNRSIHQDTFRPVGIGYTMATSSFENAKRAIYRSGPIGMGMRVWSDFMAYHAGIYRHVSTSQYMGMHATTAIGFGIDYMIGVNSWHTRWGMEGIFKIHSSEVLLYWCPGTMTGVGVGYPYPLPGGPKEADIVTSFKSDTLYVARDWLGSKLSVEVSALACHRRCVMTPACATFSYWHGAVAPGRCELHDDTASLVSRQNVISGPAKIDVDFSTKAPTTSEEASLEDCWRPTSACSPVFDYKSITYEGCSLADSNGTGWCSHESDYTSEAQWSWCVWNCAEGSTTTTTTRAT